MKTYTIQANVSGTRRIAVSERNLETIEKYGLFRHLIDSNGNSVDDWAAAELKEDYVDAMRTALIVPCNMIERYSNGLLAVMFDKKSPAEAVEECETAED